MLSLITGNVIGRRKASTKLSVSELCHSRC